MAATTLNPGDIRIDAAEIYQQVKKFMKYS